MSNSCSRLPSLVSSVTRGAASPLMNTSRRPQLVTIPHGPQPPPLGGGRGVRETYAAAESHLALSWDSARLTHATINSKEQVSVFIACRYSGQARLTPEMSPVNR